MFYWLKDAAERLNNERGGGVAVGHFTYHPQGKLWNTRCFHIPGGGEKSEKE